MSLTRPIGTLIAWYAAVLMALSPQAYANEPVDLEADYVVAPAELEAVLTDGKRLLDDEQYLDATMRFHDIVTNGEEDWPVVQEAHFALGMALVELNLYQSALLQFESIVETGSEHPKYAKTLPYLLRISRATVGDSNVPPKIAAYEPEYYPADDADELHFLVGQHYYVEDSYNDALARFGQVSEQAGEFYARAKYLEGVIHVRESLLGTSQKNVDVERLKRAAEAFKIVLRYQRDIGGESDVDQVAAMANLALGRLFFSTRQYQVAVRYYDRVDQTDPNWLQSLFEVSWVYFQLKNYPRALGNLHTLNSPYFVDQYFPESRVLQALILFYNCRYDDANNIIKEFVQDYYPLMKELREEINQFADPNAFYIWLARLSKAGDTHYSTRFKRIFNAALADRKLRRKFSLIKSLNQELELLGSLAKTHKLAAPLLEGMRTDLTAYRSLVVGETGGIAQARLLRVLKELKQHLAGALKIKGETLKASRGVLADSIRAEQAEAASIRSEILLDEEHMEWPFTGEYWRDELGFYLYDVSSRCNLSEGDETDAEDSLE